MYKRQALLIVTNLCCFYFSLFSQWEGGLGFQLYPTGAIPSVEFGYSLNEKEQIHTRVGYNIVRHRDLGEHEDERGGGFGGSFGYRYHFKAMTNSFFVGAKSDIWWNEVDWKDDIGQTTERRGSTNVTVLQPTAELGYALPIGQKRARLLLSLALGAEINVRTEGAEVGQGAILLIGATFYKQF